jgi:ComF family protein
VSIHLPLPRRVRLRAKALREAVLSAVFPQSCVCCGVAIAGDGPRACAGCDRAIRRAMNRPYCPRCGRTLAATAIHATGCVRCRSEAHWNTAGVARVGGYRDLRGTLLRLKFGQPHLPAAFLADYLADEIRRQPWSDSLEALVPVPMHYLRRLQRSSNHAHALATAIGRRLGLPVWNVVRQVRAVPSQTTRRTRHDRLDNVKGAFAPARWRPGRGNGRVVCIIDNVILSGATVHETAKVLRRLGARRIYAATIARPPCVGDPPTRPEALDDALRDPAI